MRQAWHEPWDTASLIDAEEIAQVITLLACAKWVRTSMALRT